VIPTGHRLRIGSGTLLRLGAAGIGQGDLKDAVERIIRVFVAGPTAAGRSRSVMDWMMALVILGVRQLPF
jgi:hypothetical protein